ncbi:MAG: tetratricopeptide repeat protein [Crocinitomicaceae bacterium]
MYTKTPFILSFLFIFTTFFSSKAQNSIGRQEAIQLIQEGDSFLQFGMWDRALISYSNAIETDREYAEAYMKRGQLYERILRTQEAAIDYNTAIQLNPLIDIYYDQRARLKMLSFDYYGALEDITKAIEINTSNHNYLKYQVDGFISLGMYEEALGNLDSISADEGYELYSFQRKALIHLLNDDIALAESTINKALEIDNKAYLTLDLIGLISLKKEDYQGAISWFNQAIAIDPSQYVSFYNRGICYRFLGETELALKDINQSITLNNQQRDAFFKRALIKKEQGNFEGAISDYESAISIDSSYADAIYNRSFTYKILGDYLSAEKDIDLLINDTQDKPEYWNMKGNLLVLHGDIEEAITFYNEAISINYEYSEAYYNRGIANLLLNHTIQACQDFHRSVDLGNPKAEAVILNFCGY